MIIFLTIKSLNQSFSAHEDTMLEKERSQAYLNARKSGKVDSLNTGSAILTIGFILTIVSLLADIMGYGTFDEFGILQMIGTIVGVVFILLGFMIKIFTKIWYG